MSDVFVVQHPNNPNQFDMEALNELGDEQYVLPTAPDIDNDARLLADTRRLMKRIMESGPDTVWVTMGGSPFSNILFGIALALANKDSIDFGLYSRDMDDDGRRLVNGRYRIKTMPLHWIDDLADELEKAA